jgi:4-hydroxy-tetrahydrodipicolinate synthase
VIAGTGSNDTRHTVELTTRACAAGAHAVLVVAPYYNKPSADGLRAHFFAAATAAGETPLIIYNIPSRSVINIDPPLLAEMAAKHDNIVAVKQANNDDLGPIEGLDLLAGNDESFARALELGGVGGILVASHVVGPQLRELYEAASAGEGARAAEIDAELRPVYEAMTVTSNPTPVKTALELLGIAEANLRLPLVAATDEERGVIRTALERCGLPVAAGAQG